MALDIVLLKTPYSVAFTGNPMPFVFALAPYGDTEKAQVILLQVRVLIEDTYGTGVFTEAHSQNIYPDNNGMVTLDVHTLIDPYLKWFLPKPSMVYGVIKEAPEQRKQYKLSYLLQQNSQLIGQTQETGVFLAVKGGLSYESWKPVDFFNQVEAGQPLHFPVSKNIILKDQPIFFWWLMPDVPVSACIPVSYTPVTLKSAEVGQEYDDYVYFQGSSPITISNFSGPSGMSYSSSDGTYIHLEGFPDTPGHDQTVSFTLTNCAGIPVVFTQQINVAAAGGEGGEGGGGSVCNAVQIDKGATVFTAHQGASFQFSIPYTGTNPVTIQSFTDSGGLFNQGEPYIFPEDDGDGGVIHFAGVADAAISDYDFSVVLTNCNGATDTYNGSFLITGNSSGSGGGSGTAIDVTYNDGITGQHTTQRSLTSTWKLNGTTVHNGGIIPNSTAPYTVLDTGLVAGTEYDVYLSSDTLQVFITQSGGNSRKVMFTNGEAYTKFKVNGTGAITIQ